MHFTKLITHPKPLPGSLISILAFPAIHARAWGLQQHAIVRSWYSKGITVLLDVTQGLGRQKLHILGPTTERRQAVVSSILGSLTRMLRALEAVK